MISRVGQLGGGAVVAVALAASTAVCLAAPASAGNWTEPYTWGNSEVVGYGYVTYGDNVATWQAMMGAIYGGWTCNGCYPPGAPQVDGAFGPRTRDYTVWWQTQIQAIAPQVVADGIVGTNSWNASRWFYLGKVQFNDPGPYNGNDWYVWGGTMGADGFSVRYPGILMLDATAFATWLVSNPMCYQRGNTIIGSPHYSSIWSYNCLQS